jgi:2'-5' RNA ligase
MWRLIFMAMPDASTREALIRAFESTGLRSQLGERLFDPLCWHQSLSDRYNDTAENRRLLLEAGSGVTAAPFIFGVDRLQSRGGPEAIHWSLKPSRVPGEFAMLLQSIRNALAAKRVDDVAGHSAHITISYRAPMKQATLRIPPVLWTVDEFMLVRGGGEPYRYEVLSRWKLSGKSEAPGGQLDFFGGL